jgi:hypothetical protein
VRIPCIKEMMMMLMMMIMMMMMIIITKLTDCEDSKEDSLLLIVTTHRHNKDSAIFEIATNVKRELQRQRRQIRDIITEKTKGNGRGKGYTDNSHVN